MRLGGTTADESGQSGEAPLEGCAGRRSGDPSVPSEKTALDGKRSIGGGGGKAHATRAEAEAADEHEEATVAAAGHEEHEEVVDDERARGARGT